MQYFNLFDIPVGFIIDKAALQQKFYALSRQFHPDFFTNSTEEEQAEALQNAANINKAWKIFSNADATMEYILSEMGMLGEEANTKLPNEFLLEMMDLNEAVADALASNNPQEKQAVKQQIQQLQTQLYAPIQALVENFNHQHATQETLLPIKNYYLQKKYLNRILEGVQS